ncbi:inner membrane protein YiaA [Stenotrophomonas maltophilia]|nr:hypothetical protein [Stenotrophomonas maltophilia]
MNTAMPHKPSTAFIAASWVALLLGAAAYLIGLFNAATMALNEKGYYLTLLLFGLFAAVSLQKSVRDRVEGIAVSGLYYALCWFALLSALMLLLVGLWNATLASSEKGFYGMAYALSLFGAVAVQKNTRDLIAAGGGDSRRSAVVPPLPEQD